MVKLKYNEKAASFEFPVECRKNRRSLTKEEIEILVKNNNKSDFKDWSNVLVSSAEGEFDPELICDSQFSGFVVIGRLKNATLKYHDLELATGIYSSALTDVVVGDDVVVRNVKYLRNYRVGSRVILFNIQEMDCTKHSKFGNGWLKEGEEENVRVWISVGNENDNRAILPFESMIPADAYLWSRRRSDEKLMKRLIEITEVPNTKKLDTYGVIEDEAVIKNTTL